MAIETTDLVVNKAGLIDTGDHPMEFFQQNIVPSTVCSTSRGKGRFLTLGHTSSEPGMDLRRGTALLQKVRKLLRLQQGASRHGEARTRQPQYETLEPEYHGNRGTLEASLPSPLQR
jgi:hypothetical protein